MITAITILALGSVLASGILFKHQRLLTLIAATGTLWSGQWLLLTLIDRTIVSGNTNASLYLIGSLALTLPWLFMWKQWSWPYSTTVGSGKKDFVVIIVLLGVLLAAWLVQSRNGFTNGEWVTHGFYNGDTMTMMALVERSMLSDNLVTQNPFAGNGYLEYPTLWHAGLATLLIGIGIEGDWIHYLPILTYLQILITIPLFFLVMDILWPEPKRKEEKWLGASSRMAINSAQAIIILFVMAVSWDGYIYPQSHFFLSGLLLVLVGLLITAEKKEAMKRLWWLLPANAIALVLMLSNAVTGAAAVATIVAFYLWHLTSHHNNKQVRIAYGISILLWVAMYLMWSPGDAVFGGLQFSYTAAESIMRLGPVILALAIALLSSRSNKSFISFAITILLAMALFTFLFSQRNIVVANAERFIYQGLIVGFGLLLLPSIRGYYWITNVLKFKTNDFKERFIVLGAISAIIFIVILPALISGARSHDHLMRQDEQVVDLGYRETLSFISDNTKAEDVFLINPEGPWALPMLTGRSMLRANYWLSPKDSILEEVNNAFAGDTDAQVASLQKVNYLVINHEELDNWNLNDHEEIFRGGKLSVYKTSR